VVVDAGGAEVDFGIEEFGDEGAEGVVGGEAVEVVFEIGEELLLAGAGFEVGGDASGIEELLLCEDGWFGGFEDGVEAAKDAHGKDDVGLIAAFEEVAEDVVGNAPDEGDDFVVGGWVHG
jgi:hypothetical protein